MSLQDESFPDDEFLKELELSFAQDCFFRTPNRCGMNSAYKTTMFITEAGNTIVPTLQPSMTTTTAIMTPPTTNTNTSASSMGTASSDQQNLSTESTNGRMPTEMCGKMSANDPIDLTAATKIAANAADGNPTEPVQDKRQTKSTYHRDIHNEYTKRRYRHVESKVGQYIASIKAEEQRRRAKFHRHKSMPTSLTATAAQGGQQQNQNEQQHPLRHSITDLYKLSEPAASDMDVETVNSSQHTNVMTNSTNSSSQGGPSSSTSGCGGGSSATSRHESSDEAIGGTDFIDKLAYAQLVEEKEYLETKLKEKTKENGRLKHNVDYMRVELSNCQDKLKRLSSTSNLSNRSSLAGYSYYGSRGSVDALEHYGYTNSLPYAPVKLVKATQTDFPPTMVLRTPIPASRKPDSNSSAGGRAGSNVLRQRTNSNSSAQLLKGNAGSCLRPKYPSSADTGFTDLTATKPRSRTMISSSSSSSSSPDVSPKSTPSPLHCKNAQRTYNTPNGRRAVHYTAVAMLNPSDESDIVFNDNGAVATVVPMTNVTKRATKRQQRSTSLRHRFMRLLGRCTRCDDPNQTFDSYADAMQMTQSPTPLLNRRDDNVSHSHTLR